MSQRWSLEFAGHLFVEDGHFTEALVCARCGAKTTYATTRGWGYGGRLTECISPRGVVGETGAPDVAPLRGAEEGQ